MPNHNSDIDNDGMVSGEKVFTGFVSGLTFKNKSVQYTVVDGLAIFEGDIILGSAEEMAAHTEAILSGKADALKDDLQKGVAITGAQYRWPNALMPYEIDPSLPNKNRVTDAIAHWTSSTNLSFVQRTASNASQYPNYVRFRPAENVCSSSIGMRGGQQFINLSSGCSTGNTIHEIGHAWGLWHEQSREDRDSRVTIHWENIESGKEHNFNQHISDGDDYGSYDYGSIMHYSSKAFSKNDKNTITTIPSGIAIGQRNGLSNGDIATIHAIYTTWHTHKTVIQVYATYHEQNAWAHIQDLGWRKIKTGNPDGVTNMLIALSEAKANNRTTNVYADGSTIERVYLNQQIVGK